jgi:hypothetical protein
MQNMTFGDHFCLVIWFVSSTDDKLVCYRLNIGCPEFTNVAFQKFTSLSHLWKTWSFLEKHSYSDEWVPTQAIKVGVTENVTESRLI